jgi:hypothetical protein
MGAAGEPTGRASEAAVEAIAKVLRCVVSFSSQGFSSEDQGDDPTVRLARRCYDAAFEVERGLREKAERERDEWKQRLEGAVLNLRDANLRAAEATQRLEEAEKVLAEKGDE